MAMPARGLLVVTALILLVASARAQTVLPDAIAIVTDPVSLGREVTDNGAPFEVQVVFLHPNPALRGVGGVEFGIEVDEGLLLVGTSTAGLSMELAPREYAISFPGCGAASPGSAFVLMTLTLFRLPDAPAGAGVRLRELTSRGEPIKATRCGTNEEFPVVDFGGVVVNPDSPAIAGFAVSPPTAIAGDAYHVGWATAGGGTWTLDGSPVAGSGSAELVATSSRDHELRSDDGTSAQVRSIEVLNLPRIAEFSWRPHELYENKRWLSWNVQGANSCRISGNGPVSSSGTKLVDPAGLYELIATNDWGQSFAVVEAEPLTGPPVIAEFRADPPVYRFGETVVLVYRAPGATSVTITPGPERVPIGEDRVVVHPEGAAQYTMTATNRFGSVDAVVALDAPLPWIHWFRPDPEVFGPGLPVELQYGVEGADSLWVEPGGALSGPEGSFDVVSPDQSRLYVLHARNAAGEATAELDLVSSPPQLVLSAQPKFARGEPITLHHSSKWADRLILLPDSVELNPADHLDSRHVVHPTEATTFTLIGTNEAGTTVVTHTIVPGPPSITEFRLDPLPGMVGQPFDIIWKIFGADRIEFEGFPGLTIPDTVSLEDGRVTWAYTEPYRDSYDGFVRLRAFNDYGESWDYLDDIMWIYEEQPLIKRWYAGSSRLQTGYAAILYYDAARFATITVTDENGDEVRDFENGYRAYPGPGSHFWVMHARYRSIAETDTAWVTVDPSYTMWLTPTTVFPGEETTIRWFTNGADRVTIEPGVGEVPHGGEVRVPVYEYTRFTFSAWKNGVREVYQESVNVSTPTIPVFQFRPNWIMPDESTWLHWEVLGSDSVRVTSPSGMTWEVTPVDSLFVEAPDYRRWSLRAWNSAGVRERTSELYAPYIEFDEFYADPPAIVLGDSTTLYWNVENALSVEMVGVEGELPPQGQMVVHPTESVGYEINALGPTHMSYRVAPVRVDLDAARPATIMVSASPDSLVHEPEPVPRGNPDLPPRYEVWVRIENVLGTIRAVNFAVDIPDWLEVSSWEANGEVAWSRNRIDQNCAVYLGRCEPGQLNSTWVAKVVLDQVADPPDGEPPVVRISPGTPSGAPVHRVPPTWRWCGQDAEFGFTLPGMTLETAEPLRILPEGVPVMRLPLDARWVDAGLELHWTDPPKLDFASLELRRGVGGDAMQTLANVDPRQPWVDTAAPRLFHEGGLRYQLVGVTAAGAIWRSEELAITEAPDLVRPTMTRLLGARPNPFNPQTAIQFELANPGPVTVSIYDLAGRLVRDWHLGELPWGPGQVVWDGTDRRGARAASGVYLVRLLADSVVDVKRVTLLK